MAWRVVLRHEGSPALAQRIERVRAATRAEIEAVYAPELARAGETARLGTLIALEAVLDLAVWGEMRTVHGLSCPEAEAAWALAIDRLLPPDA